MFEKYLDKATYAYTIHSKFTKDTLPHIVVTEFTPTGEESKPYILFQEGNKIYNNECDHLATINGEEVELVEP